MSEISKCLGENRVYQASEHDVQELRATQVGHVILNSGMDRPWPQSFCCTLAGHREFTRKYPIATKRALCAMLNGASVCTLEPDRVGQSLVDKGYARRFDDALQTLKDLPYSRWREDDPEETVRFYALRLHEVGMMKSSPPEDHCPGHRLALPERAQTSAEGITEHIRIRSADPARA